MTDYTGKDFPAIFNELLNLIPNLTDKWSGESELDPGVVLTKLMAVIGDKINYNSDKNSLENLIEYVTQRKNARALFKDRGYNMSWYNAGSGRVTVTVRDIPDVMSQKRAIIKFDTPVIFTNEDGTLQYSCIRSDQNNLEVTIGNSITFNVIQGTYIKHKVDNSENILVSSLKDLSIQLQHINIAQNAIFVKGDTNTEFFERVDNILLYPDKNCFELYIDDKEQICTLKFSQAIRKYTSLNISYIITNGVEGNVSPGTITQIVSGVKYSIDENGENTGTFDVSMLGIKQLESIKYGADPETIDEAHQNYKLQLPANNAIITSKDYYKRIKSMKNSVGSNMVSNCVITDRNTDINYSKSAYVMENGVEVYKVVQNSYNPFILFAYLIGELSNYAGGFTPIISNSVLGDINDALKQDRIIELKLTYPFQTQEELDSNSILYWVLAYYGVNMSVVTKEKVSKSQGAEIINNIFEAIKKKYDCKNLVPGQSIDYYELYSVCVNSDPRIQALGLQPLNYRFVTINAEVSGEDQHTTTTSSNALEELSPNFNIDSSSGRVYVNLIENLIMQGKIPYYRFENFRYSIARNSKLTPNITSISTNVIYNLTGNEQEEDKTYNVTVKNNEIISLMSPHYEKITQYSGNDIHIILVKPQNTDEDISVEENTTFTLKKGKFYDLEVEPKFQNGNELYIYVNFDKYDDKGLLKDSSISNINQYNIYSEASTYKVVSENGNVTLSLSGDEKPTLLTVNDKISVYKKSEQNLGPGKYVMLCNGEFFNNIEENSFEKGCYYDKKFPSISDSEDPYYTLHIDGGSCYYIKPGEQLLFTPQNDTNNIQETISFGSGTVLYNSSESPVIIDTLKKSDLNIANLDISFWKNWSRDVHIFNSELATIPSGTSVKITSKGYKSISSKYIENECYGPGITSKNLDIEVIQNGTYTPLNLSTFGNPYIAIPIMTLYLIENQEATLYAGQQLVCTQDYIGDDGKYKKYTIYGDGRDRQSEEIDNEKLVPYTNIICSTSIPIEFCWCKNDDKIYTLMCHNPDPSTIKLENVDVVTDTYLRTPKFISINGQNSNGQKVQYSIHRTSGQFSVPNPSSSSEDIFSIVDNTIYYFNDTYKPQTTIKTYLVPNDASKIYIKQKNNEYSIVVAKTTPTDKDAIYSCWQDIYNSGKLYSSYENEELVLVGLIESISVNDIPVLQKCLVLYDEPIIGNIKLQVDFPVHLVTNYSYLLSLFINSSGYNNKAADSKSTIELEYSAVDKNSVTESDNEGSLIIEGSSLGRTIFTRFYNKSSIISLVTMSVSKDKIDTIKAIQNKVLEIKSNLSEENKLNEVVDAINNNATIISNGCSALDNISKGLLIYALPHISVIMGDFTDLSEFSKLTDEGKESLLKVIKSSLDIVGFNYNHSVIDPLSNIFGIGVFDTKHPYNRYTLPVLDMKNSNIEIATQSRSY